MSRLTTRSKNKRHRTDEGDDASSEILRRIHLTGEVTQNDFCQLYLINKPVCQGCRVNSRDSPNCFCGLIPPSSGARKSGLWQKLSDLISSLLGSDPCEDHRVPTERPGGLTNVGATCYANSILQCLYMNVSFRAGIFSVEPDLLKQHPVLDQLAQLFAELHSSEKAVIDSAPFVKTLELDKGSQQDSHEFLTLFLSLLEHSLSHSKIPKARTLIQDLFRGSVSHVTRCSLCGKDSEASSKMEDFYGLELNIKGLNNLEESLDDYLSIEQLSGENQYFCQSCGKRVDATHCIKLRALPSVLIFQLKRYDFLMETTKKKKITSSFSFPRQLNLGRRLGDATESELLYDLSAILIHKGAAANSGHYVARIKDENSGQWWEFDDEVVSKLGLQPFGGASSNSSADSQPTLQSEEVHSLSNGNQNATTQKLHLGSNNSQHQEIFSPTDAYMLIYNCIRTKKDGKGSDKMLGANAEHEDAKLVSEHVAILPSHLSEEIEKLNAPYAQECHEYKLKKDKQVAYITERRKEVKSILSEAPVHSVEDPFFWVSTDWLRQWADNVDDPLCLDNSTIQCSHGKVAVNKVSCMKRISASAWSHLVSKYGGGPALSSDDYCIECLKEEARSSVSADDYRGRRASFKQIAEAALAGNCPDGTSYYVSRTWLVQWLRRKNVDSPCDADAGPTASLRCPHGCLLPEQSSGAKRVRVPESLWLFFSESAKAVKPDDLLGCLPFCSDSQPCVACSTELSEVVCHEGNLREVKLRQRQNHEKLFAGKNITLYPGHKYFLVPSSWLTKWRAYVTSTGKNISSSVEPESLEVIINSLKCEKHARLLDRPIGLVCRRGLIAQRSLNAGLTMIPESDWKLFCDEWEVAEEKGITSEIVLTKSITNKLAGSSEEAPILEEDSNPSSDEVVSELEAKDLIIKTDPDICEDCIGERESCELMRKLNYCNEEITVHLIRGKEVPRSLLEASANISELDRRTSKRSRRTSSGKICTLKVSGTTSVYQLKMMIWECFGVVKENQKLHKGPIEIEDDSATLADKNIFPGDVLWVGDSEIHENRDIADELSEPKGELQQAEEGFRGTLLTSSVSFEERHDPAISSQL